MNEQNQNSLALPPAGPPAGGAASSNTSSKMDFDNLTFYLRQGDITLALGVVCILVVLVLPMPTWLLDMCLAISITFSVLILMTVLFIARSLEFSSFPTVLLISTLLRLSLNLASTRLILAHGHEGVQAAGKVIQAFGSYVTGNNYVIGIIVFAILTLVNFVVITKGSGRIAEVAARFNLDAMPGKQMAIDADLSSGLLSEDQARAKRKEIEEESTFFGSMDGAAKFVRGDAIAGLLITFINIIGGIIIGVVQKGIPFGQAAQSYTLLTIGDGLVTQIPALIVSIAAGMLVSKSGVSGSTDKAFFGQLGQYPRAMGLSAILMLSMAFLPSMPVFPFLVLAGAAGSLAWLSNRSQETKLKNAKDATQAKKVDAAQAGERTISQVLSVDLIRLELGFGLLTLVNEGEEKRLTKQIKGIRQQIASDIGFVMPSVRIQDNLRLNQNEYKIYIKEIESASGEIRPNLVLAMNPIEQRIELPGDFVKEPTFGLPAVWIEPSLRDEAQFKGYTVVDPETVIATHLTECIKENMAELLSYTETQKLLDGLGSDYKNLISDLIPGQITLNGLQRVLQNLLAERVSIRDLPSVLEGISEASTYTKNLGMITEHVRSRLSRQISHTHLGQEGYIPIITLSPQWENVFADSLLGEGEERQLSLPPTQLQQFIKLVKEKFDKQSSFSSPPILLTSPAVRPYVRSLVERFRPMTAVLSQNEIHPKVKIKTLDQI